MTKRQFIKTGLLWLPAVSGLCAVNILPHRRRAFQPVAGGGGASQSDNFDSYNNGDNLTVVGPWATVIGGFVCSKPAADGRFNSTGSWLNFAYRTGTTFAANQSSECTNVSGIAGVIVRGSTNQAYYALPDGSNIYFGGFHTPDAYDEVTAPISISSGNKTRLEVTGSDASIVVTLKYDVGSGWQTYGTTYSPPVNFRFNSGSPGISAYGTGAMGDNWIGADL